MFLPWTIFAVNLVLTALQILLVGTVGALLALYSRFGGEYANSIRWVRQGGYLEMFEALFNSRNAVPNAAKVAMVVTILASVLSNVMDNGASYFITPTVRYGNASHEVANSTKVVLRTEQSVIDGWSATIHNGDDVIETIELLLNNTQNIPDAKPGRIYTPRTSKYDIGQDRLCVSFAFEVNIDIDKQLLYRNENCTYVDVLFTGGFSNITKERRSNITANQVSATIPCTIEKEASQADPDSPLGFVFIQGIREISAVTSVRHTNGTCSIVDRSTSLTLFYVNGLTSTPTTYITKCMYPTGEIVGLATSSARLHVSSDVFFNVTHNTTIELFRAMDVSMKNTTDPRNTLFVEARINNTTVETLLCYWNLRMSDEQFITCIYHVVETIITTKQEENVIMSKSHGNGPYKFRQRPSATMVIRHIPPELIGISSLRNATTTAAKFLVMLGQNFYIDWSIGRSYILFDTVDAQSGFYVPDWLAICVLSMMIVCIIIWGSTTVFLNSKYTSSLYKITSMQMSPRMGVNAPMLMRARLDPLEFEKMPVMPLGEAHEMDDPLLNAIDK